MTNPVSGILPSQDIIGMRAAGAVSADRPFDDDQVQPASLDLRLGPRIWRVRASFLPGPTHTVMDRLNELQLHEIDLNAPAVLETGCVYIAEIEERLTLPVDVAAAANPKSSTGRLDVFTRVIVDRARAFDTVPAGYAGRLFAEISPRTFPVLVRRGSRLSQIRFRRGNARLNDEALAHVHREAPLVTGGDAVIDNGVHISIDLSGINIAETAGVVGFRAKRHTGLIDIDARVVCDPDDFWEPIRSRAGQGLVLDPYEFYILVSREAVTIPPACAAEMVPFDPLVGEFRVHYAGFFDPGFGYAPAGGAGARAVLEVRSHEVPFILEHGQTVGRLVYERMGARPDTIYGAELGSNYQGQGLKLSRHFRAFT